MPLNRKWKSGILVSFISFSLALFFIPYREESAYGYFDPYVGIARSEGADYMIDIPVPWRSHTQALEILLNVSKGKVNMLIMDKTEYLNWRWELPYTPFLQYENITFFDDVIRFDPPLEGLIFILIVAVEDSTINPKMWFSHLIYHSNYGFFFLGISLILGLVYLNQIRQKKFNYQ